MIVTEVPPVIGPDVGLTPETVGITGFHTQLFTDMVEPQETTHSAVVGELTPGG
ncbi:MAG: hypothetical protein ABSA31_09555 [Acidimicrobiales bacterium]